MDDKERLDNLEVCLLACLDIIYRLTKETKIGLPLKVDVVHRISEDIKSVTRSIAAARNSGHI